jgi:Icc-related predicted phosphoesterase
MKILHLSDTHNRHRDLGEMPEADVLVHSGDFTMSGSDMEALDFLEWLCDLPYKHKIFIAGNHDDCMIDATLEGLPDNVHYLHDSGIIIDGVSFYGVPMLAEFADGEMKLTEHYDLIPDKADVLITHRAPLGILDSTDSKIHYGSSLLLDKVDAIKPRLCLFGHTHDAYGIKMWEGITFSNGAVTDSKYDLLYSPQVLLI